MVIVRREYNRPASLVPAEERRKSVNWRKLRSLDRLKLFHGTAVTGNV